MPSSSRSARAGSLTSASATLQGSALSCCMPTGTLSCCGSSFSSKQKKLCSNKEQSPLETSQFPASTFGETWVIAFVVCNYAVK